MALALSGGGAKGSYEAGALWGLVMNNDNKTKFAYDVVTGVSAGAINTSAAGPRSGHVGLKPSVWDSWWDMPP